MSFRVDTEARHQRNRLASSFVSYDETTATDLTALRQEAAQRLRQQQEKNRFMVGANAALEASDMHAFLASTSRTSRGTGRSTFGMTGMEGSYVDTFLGDDAFTHATIQSSDNVNRGSAVESSRHSMVEKPLHPNRDSVPQLDGAVDAGLQSSVRLGPLERIENSQLDMENDTDLFEQCIGRKNTDTVRRSQRKTRNLRSAEIDDAKVALEVRYLPFHNHTPLKHTT